MTPKEPRFDAFFTHDEHSVHQRRKVRRRALRRFGDALLRFGFGGYQDAQ